MPSSATHRGGTHRRQPTSVGKCVPARVFKFLRPHGKAGARRFGAACGPRLATVGASREAGRLAPRSEGVRSVHRAAARRPSQPHVHPVYLRYFVLA